MKHLFRLPGILTPGSTKNIEYQEIVPKQRKMKHPYHPYERFLSALSLWFGRVGAIILTIMMLMVFTDVFLRYIFNRPLEGSIELIEIMMALTIALGMAYTGMKRGHIAVELVVSRFSPRIQALLDLFHFLVATILFLLMGWKTAQQALVVGKRHVTTSVLAIPIYPFVWVLSICAALLGLVFLLHFLQALSKVRGK
ncbi:MAG: TRAP transporter small permease [Deltaproteobacteria bacterium]|nr:TRAP transporter small permease [Deltaproteobacteria bacterium]